MGKLVNSGLKSETGVYGIYDSEGKILYIGQSVDINKRYSNHNARLKQGNHSNSYLQSIYDNADVLYFKVIKYTDTPEEAIELEHKLISETNGLCNIRTDMGKVVKYSDESRQKMSKSQSGSNNGNCCKLSEIEVREIILRVKNGEKQCDVARDYNISQGYVSNIIANRKWKNLIYRYIGDGTGEPLADNLVLKFETDEKTVRKINKMIEILGSENICRAVSKMQRS